eukprot:TRINITY_DN2682_c0_g1_i2.p1 TRINITY_DN2682_c0_g1~~TRINITY_DN2682_c0_g1_i2.p1  ORF type:complete len:196 (-),score=29.30 TRINITY_DN2682_c0_g1_i2:69-656(-)
MPLLYLLVLLVLWVVPMKSQLRRIVFVLSEIFNAWSALEVFVVSVIAALLEIEQFAKFIIGNRCDQINVLLQDYASDLLEGDNVCFDVVATLKEGCWILFAGCLLYLLVGTLVMKICHKVLEEAGELPGGNHHEHNGHGESEPKKKACKKTCSAPCCFATGLVVPYQEDDKLVTSLQKDEAEAPTSALDPADASV